MAKFEEDIWMNKDERVGPNGPRATSKCRTALQECRNHCSITYWPIVIDWTLDSQVTWLIGQVFRGANPCKIKFFTIGKGWPEGPLRPSFLGFGFGTCLKNGSRWSYVGNNEYCTQLKTFCKEYRFFSNFSLHALFTYNPSKKESVPRVRWRRPKCDRIAPSHPLSWPCVSDLLLLKGESWLRTETLDDSTPQWRISELRVWPHEPFIVSAPSSSGYTSGQNLEVLYIILNTVTFETYSNNPRNNKEIWNCFETTIGHCFIPRRTKR